MRNKFVPTYRSLESSNYFFGSYMTNGRQRVNRLCFANNGFVCSLRKNFLQSIGVRRVLCVLKYRSYLQNCHNCQTKTVLRAFAV